MGSKLNTNLPILYSFRRCPYAMRARLALYLAKVKYAHREIELKNKPKTLLDISPKATVPVLSIGGQIIDESLDIMIWAFAQSSQKDWIPSQESEAFKLINENDNQFKFNLDRYKYPNRYNIDNPQQHFINCIDYACKLENRLERNQFLFGNSYSFADLAIFPFVRQFFNVDRESVSHLEKLETWLNSLCESKMFATIMISYPIWRDETEELIVN